MKNFKLALIGLAAFATSCSESTSKNDTANNDTVSTMKMATDSNTITAAVNDTTAMAKPTNWAGTYKTSYPEGYDSYEIMLHNDSTYMYTAIYHGDKARTVKLKGTFTWIGAGAIKLNDAKSEPAEYLVKENELTQVNKDPQSEVVITLTKEK